MVHRKEKMIIHHKPIFDQKDAEAVNEVIKHGWISEGPETKKFEENCRKFIGTKYAMATTSGTTALFLALASVGIQRNDEVIIPNMTFAATAMAVELAGAKPVLSEINEDDFTISVESVKKKNNKKN